MNKFDRVVTILMLLQTKKVVRAHELADRFEVSERTIYRDLRTLEHAGVPIHAEAGIGYSLVEGYSLPPVMFTEDEATSFLIAEKLVEKMTDEETTQHFSQAVSKIKSVLRSKEKEKINNLENHIHVSRHFSSQSENNEKRMQDIFRSIDSRMVLKMTYEAIYNGNVSERIIEPLGLHFYGDHWHLIAYCQLRKDYRDFRIDRIIEIEETTDKFLNEHPSLTDYLTEVAKKQELYKVTVAFHNGAEQYARTDKFFYGFVGEKRQDEVVEMEFLVPSLHGIAHWFLVYTDNIKIIHPLELNGMMKELSERISKNYQ